MRNFVAESQPSSNLILIFLLTMKLFSGDKHSVSTGTLIPLQYKIGFNIVFKEHNFDVVCTCVTGDGARGGNFVGGCIMNEDL